MESEPERISSSTTTTPPKSRFKLIAVIAIVAVAVIVGAFLVSAFLSSPQGQNAWLFKGAYATYEGSASISAEDLGSMLDMSMSIDFTVREEIVDFNSTHALVSTSFQMSSSLGEFGGETVEDENSTWVPLSKMGLMTAFEDVNLTNSYESTVSITGLGTRSCMVYEYAIAEEGLTMTVYVDKNIDWLLKMTISMTNTELPSGDLTVDINLKETNIPALK